MLSSKDPHQLTTDVLIKAIQQSSDEIDLGDCLIELRNRYLPLIKSQVARYYDRGMEFEDWLQEAIYVMIKSIRRYNVSCRIKFGVFYRRCLTNWFNDLVRKNNAKKRVPTHGILSYNANQGFYDDVMVDMKATRPDGALRAFEMLKQVINNCSDLERTVMLEMIKNHRSPITIAKTNQCSINKIKNAFSRCKAKYQSLQDRGQN